jgi:hypothetical protein
MQSSGIHPQPVGSQLLGADNEETFTSVQLRTVLEENHHRFLIVEHNPLLYERARDMADGMPQAMKQDSREATILLYAPVSDRHLESSGQAR